MSDRREGVGTCDARPVSEKGISRQSSRRCRWTGLFRLGHSLGDCVVYTRCCVIGERATGLLRELFYRVEQTDVALLNYNKSSREMPEDDEWRSAMGTTSRR